MTQKEKIVAAMMFAQSAKSIARRLKFDANDYGVKFPIDLADELIDKADDLLKKL